ncbi:MAG: LTA synthase family protein [Bdellovibrionia bacterium]
MAAIAFMLSIAMLRLEQLRITHLDWPHAQSAGLIAGLTADLALVLCICGFQRAASVTGPRIGKISSILFSAAIWTLLAANICYFSFFQSELYLWIATSYSENAWSIRNVALRLLERPYILASFTLFLLGAAAMGFRKWEAQRLKHAATGALLITAALIIRQSPHWNFVAKWFENPQISESIFANNIAWRWVDDIENHRWNKRVPIERYEKILPEAPRLLAQYSQINSEQQRRVDVSKKLRKLLGFSENQKLNFVILFLESGRAYELLSPKTSNEVYPEFRKVLAHHGILFRQAYSMANYTVQGQFSTLCSRMDRFDTAPTYSRQPYAKVTCLPSLFKENGYDTYWMNPYHRYFGGKYVFETNHGTDHFLDREFFVPRTSEEAKASREWGVSDDTFLSEAIEKLESIHQDGKPFFAHLLTTGTHAPWQTLPDYPLSTEMQIWSEGNSDYAGYLSSARGLDHALGKFFDRFFKSPLAKDTVIVVMGDHGTGIAPPHAELSQLQTNLLWPRIILSVISKDLQTPKVVTHPVHQMDVAPLLTSIAGISQPRSWLGREPLISGQGTLWVKRNGNRFLYRTQDRLCGKLSGSKPLLCWHFAAQIDPMFGSEPHLISENKEQTLWFKSVIDANEALLELAGGDASALSPSLSNKM